MTRKGKPATKGGSIKPEASSKDFFSQESLNSIFKKSQQYPDRLTTRESTWLEFKESFNWASREDYAKTIAAFANTKGGYIVFGVGNNPKLLIGLKSNNFENLEEAKVTGFLNDTFSPEIKWHLHLYLVDRKVFGLIYIEEAADKPIIAKKNIGKEVKEGEIYYRYRGRSEKIKYPELRKIIEEQQQLERDYWVRHLKQITKVGVTNAAIFDLRTGEVTGSRGAFVIDGSLLPRLKFIKEGEFHETKGAPTLKLIGELRATEPGLIQPSKIVSKTKAIGTGDVVHAFLDKEQVSESLEYIKRICFESSGYLPVYYFMKLAGYSRSQTIAMMKQVVSKSQSKIKLLERLESGESLGIVFPSVLTKAAKEKKKYRDQILNKSIDEKLEPKERRYLLQAIRTLGAAEIDESYLLPLLKQWFDNYYEVQKFNLADDLRRAICHIDIVMNRPSIND